MVAIDRFDYISFSCILMFSVSESFCVVLIAKYMHGDVFISVCSYFSHSEYFIAFHYNLEIVHIWSHL